MEGNAARKQRELVSKFKNAMREKRVYLADYQNSEQYRLVLENLEQWITPEFPESVSELPNYWRQAFQVSSVGDSEEMARFGRHELLIVMEIIEGKPVVSGEEDLRKGIQLKMMASKLQHGDHADLDELLKLWISKGPLSEEDKSLLSRLRFIFTHPG